MARKRQFVDYPPDVRYVVTMEGHDWEHWTVTIESVTEDQYKSEHSITAKDRMPDVSNIVEFYLKDRHPEGKPVWSDYIKGNFGVDVHLVGLLNADGYELARQRLEDGEPRHIVALCGSPSEAVELLDDLNTRLGDDSE